MNENYALYVERGQALLAQKAAQEEAATKAAEQRRAERNRSQWHAHLKPVFDTVPADLHSFIRFNDATEPTYWNGYDHIHRSAEFDYVPLVPIKIEVDRMKPTYSVARAHRIDHGENGDRYIVYEYRGAYDNIFEAIAAAHATGGHNATMELKLDEPELSPAPAPEPKTPLTLARSLLHSGDRDEAHAWLLLSIAESLNAISSILDGTIYIKDVYKY